MLIFLLLIPELLSLVGALAFVSLMVHNVFAVGTRLVKNRLLRIQAFVLQTGRGLWFDCKSIHGSPSVLICLITRVKIG